MHITKHAGNYTATNNVSVDIILPIYYIRKYIVEISIIGDY